MASALPIYQPKPGFDRRRHRVPRASSAPVSSSAPCTVGDAAIPCTPNQPSQRRSSKKWKYWKPRDYVGSRLSPDKAGYRRRNRIRNERHIVRDQLTSDSDDEDSSLDDLLDWTPEPSTSPFTVLFEPENHGIMDDYLNISEERQNQLLYGCEDGPMEQRHYSKRVSRTQRRALDIAHGNKGYAAFVRAVEVDLVAFLRLSVTWMCMDRDADCDALGYWTLPLADDCGVHGNDKDQDDDLEEGDMDAPRQRAYERCLEGVSATTSSSHSLPHLVFLLPDSFHRLLVHALCAHHGLDSLSDTLPDGRRVTRVRVEGCRGGGGDSPLRDLLCERAHVDASPALVVAQ